MVVRRTRESIRTRGVAGTLGAVRIVTESRLRAVARSAESRWWGYRGLDAEGVALRARSGAFAAGTILTARFDGFGGRFGDVLNGWRVAQSLGASFRFHWPERDLTGIRHATSVFSPEFCAAHLTESVRLAGARPVSSLRRRDLRSLSQGAVLWFDSVGRRDFIDKFTIDLDDVVLPDLMTMGEAFARIPLSPRLDQVRAWASQVPPFDLAIHLRRGDIYEGDFRLGGQYANKALPLPLADRLLQGLGDGARVLLVGNDLERVRARLRTDAEVLVPADLDCPGDEEADAVDFKDHCLLTRSRRVVAGRSVFALVPSHVAGVRLELPGEVIEAEGAVTDLLRFVREGAQTGVPDLEVSLACEYLWSEYAGRLGPRDREELVEVAYRADPQNPVYILSRTAILFRDGRGTEARQTLASAAPLGTPELCVRLLRHEFDLEPGVGLTRIWGGFLGESDRATLLAAAEDDGWAAFYSALDLAASGDLDRAGRLLDAASVRLEHPAVGAAYEVLLQAGSERGPRGGSLMAPTSRELG